MVDISSLSENLEFLQKWSEESDPELADIINEAEKSAQIHDPSPDTQFYEALKHLTESKEKDIMEL